MAVKPLDGEWATKQEYWDWGDSSSSKSFKICQMIAANKKKYKDKFKYCYLDIEHGNNINTKKLYGFDIDKESWNHLLMCTAKIGIMLL